MECRGALIPRAVRHTCSPWRAALSHREGPSLGPSECLDPSALTGVSVLLVAHEGPVVAQDVHGMLPVPAGAAVVLEAGLVSTNGDVFYRLWKLCVF